MNNEKIAAKIQFEMMVTSVQEMAIELMLLELYGIHDSHATTSWYFGPFCPKEIK